MSAQTANAIYGIDPTRVAPTATAMPVHLGAPEPTMATDAPAGAVKSPLVALVVLLGIVVLLTQLSFRGTINVSA